MDQVFYIIIALIVLILLIVIFFATYVMNKRTPIPKGCEKQLNEHCSHCKNTLCEYQGKENK